MPLIVELLQALAAAMPERDRAMVITHAGLGLRVGELLALRTENVDFLRRTVRIVQRIAPAAKVRASPQPHVPSAICLPQVVADAFVAHLATFPPGAQACEDGTGSHVDPIRPPWRW